MAVFQEHDPWALPDKGKATPSGYNIREIGRFTSDGQERRYELLCDQAPIPAELPGVGRRVDIRRLRTASRSAI